MVDQNLHQALEQASEQVKTAQESVIQAQGSDAQLLEHAEQQLKHAEHQLEQIQSQAGTEATENPQFQQAYEQLHNIRQQIQDVKHNFKELS